MSITPFSLVLLGIVSIIIIRKKRLTSIFESLFALNLIVTLNIRMGYFVQFGTRTLNYASILTYFLGFVSIVLLMTSKAKRNRGFIAYMEFLGVLLLGIVIIAMFPYRELVITGDWTNYVLGKGTYQSIDISSIQPGYYLMFISYGLIIFQAKKSFNEITWGRVINKVIDVSKYYIVLGYIEWIITNIFHSKIITDLSVSFFGTFGAQQNLLVRRGLLYSVQGFTKEASMFNTSIFYLALALMVSMYVYKNKRRKKWLIASIILLAINPAMSAYLYILILFIVGMSIGLVNVRNRDKMFWIRIIIIVLVSTSVVVYIWKRADAFETSSNYALHRLGLAVHQLENIFSSNAVTYSSEGIRFAGINYDFQLFLKRPLFGVGLGAVSCNSGIITFLVNAGILGVVFWIRSLRKMVVGEDKRGFALLIEILLLPNLILNDYETILCMIIPVICFVYETKNRRLVGMRSAI